ncbi:MAG: FHA domain-containing protein [Chloroflexota bacterium]
MSTDKSKAKIVPEEKILRLVYTRIDPNTSFQTVDVAPGTILGRSRRCTIRLNDPRVSKEHACIEYNDGHFWLVDLNSSNKILMDGREQRRGARIPLINNSRFEIRPFQFIVRIGTKKEFEQEEQPPIVDDVSSLENTNYVRLRWYDPDINRTQHALINVPCWIGREGSICKVHLNRKWIGRKKIQLDVRADAIYLIDLGVKNKFRVNGRQQKQTELKAGDIIEIPPFKLDVMDMNVVSGDANLSI